MSVQSYYKNKIFIILGIISLTSILVKLYSVDFTLPIYSDSFDTTMRAFAHLGGNFDVSLNRNFGWSLFQSPFLLLVNSDNFLDYSQVIRLLGMGVSTVSIFVMYLLSRKFFNEKYSLVAASLFAFSPQLNQIAGLGQTEPLFILCLMGSLFFILRKNNDKIIFLSFALAGIAYSIRPIGMIMLVILLIIYFINFRKNRKYSKFILCILLFLLVIFPISLIRYEQYEDPLFYGDVTRGFVTSSSMLYAENVEPVTSTEFIQNNGLDVFLKKFILSGIFNSFKGIVSVSLPYLIILIPVGLILSTKLKSEIKNFILANWVLIISYSASLIVVSSIVLSPRFFLPLIPFLIIISILPIQKICDLNLKKKNYQTLSLASIIFVILSSSAVYTYFEYPPPDFTLESEKLEFASYLHHNLDGKFFNSGWSTHYFSYVHVTDNNLFKTFYLDENHLIKNDKVQRLQLYGSSIDEIILDGEKLDLNYLVIDDKNVDLNFLDQIYLKEDVYPYLTKVFDSNNAGYEKLKVKVFKIDYEQFYN